MRALILTPDQEILLMRIRPLNGWGQFWIAPGGGLEDGETEEEGLRRELQEELGLSDFTIGPLVWRRHHTFNWGSRRISQREEYRIVHVDRFEPLMTDLAESEIVDCFRWWRIVDLDHAKERLTPLSLPDIMQRYLTNGPPTELPDEEVLID